MDVPLALNNIGIRNGLKGYKRKSSTFSQQADVDGFFAFYSDSKNHQVLVTSIILLS